jgi:type II secretory pathway pseudopilin PulG
MLRWFDEYTKTDAGFTLAELVMAAAILLVGAVAIISLVTGALSASQVARDKAALTNAVAGQMENIRSLHWYQIGTVGSSDPTGTVPAVTTVTAGQYTIRLTSSIVWKDDARITGTKDYKDVVVTGRGTRPNASRVMTYTTESYVTSYTTH